MSEQADNDDPVIKTPEDFGKHVNDQDVLLYGRYVGRKWSCGYLIFVDAMRVGEEWYAVYPQALPGIDRSAADGTSLKRKIDGMVTLLSEDKTNMQWNVGTRLEIQVLRTMDAGFGKRYDKASTEVVLSNLNKDKEKEEEPFFKVREVDDSALCKTVKQLTPPATLILKWHEDGVPQKPKHKIWPSYKREIPQDVFWFLVGHAAADQEAQKKDDEGWLLSILGEDAITIPEANWVGNFFEAAVRHWLCEKYPDLYQGRTYPERWDDARGRSSYVPCMETDTVLFEKDPWQTLVIETKLRADANITEEGRNGSYLNRADVNQLFAYVAHTAYERGRTDGMLLYGCDSTWSVAWDELGHHMCARSLDLSKGVEDVERQLEELVKDWWEGKPFVNEGEPPHECEDDDADAAKEAE